MTVATFEEGDDAGNSSVSAPPPRCWTVPRPPRLQRDRCPDRQRLPAAPVRLPGGARASAHRVDDVARSQRAAGASRCGHAVTPGGREAQGAYLRPDIREGGRPSLTRPRRIAQVESVPVSSPVGISASVRPACWAGAAGGAAALRRLGQRPRLPGRSEPGACPLRRVARTSEGLWLPVRAEASRTKACCRTFTGLWMHPLQARRVCPRASGDAPSRYGRPQQPTNRRDRRAPGRLPLWRARESSGSFSSAAAVRARPSTPPPPQWRRSSTPRATCLRGCGPCRCSATG